MICSSCGSESPAGKRFCADCGAPLERACPACGAATPPGKRFCADCGAPLPGGEAAPAPAISPASAPAHPSAVAERRLVSVLFADLVGFTTISEGRDPEDTRDLLSRYFDLAGAVIAAHGGNVEKFIGDAVMAVWGAPVAREGDAERAVRAALELVEAVPSLGEAIQARAGVLTGEVAVTLGATAQGMVAGDLVNTASRLQAGAAPGTVLVGEATARAAARAILFEEAGEHAVRGRAEPVRALRAVRVVAGAGGRDRREQLEPPFVGREEQLRLLKDLLGATGRDRHAHLVSIVGPTGIGKSRLAWELSKYVDGLLEDVWWHEGRCPAYGDGVTFWALGEMIRRRCGLLETDDEAATKAAVATAVQRWIFDEGERRWIEAALLTLLGVGGASAGTEQLFAAWRTFFERMAESGPVVLLFEDFHHADAGLIGFTEHLLDWARDKPILVLTLARPDLLEPRPDRASARRNFTNLHLEPLSDAAVRSLLDGLVPGLPERAARAIVGRAEGIPLYAVETVRMLLDQGRLVRDGEAYKITADLGDIAVPETLTELIGSRLDALERPDRALLQDASVLGQSFTVPALVAVSAADEAGLEGRLRGLVVRELLTVVADHASPERGQFAFVQALIREVAYGTLARRDRVRRHLAAARYFESLGSEELAGALAGQYLAAYRNATEGPEADALASQARIALKAAADRAAALGSHAQAVTFATEALELTTDPPEQAALLEVAGRAASAVVHHSDAERFLRRALLLHEQAGDRPATARATATLGWAMLQANETARAIELLEAGAAAFADLAGDTGYAALQGQLARGYMMDFRPGRALEVAEPVLASAERLELIPLLADTLVTKGSALVDVGRPVEGIGILRAGWDLAAANDLQRTALRAMRNLGIYLDDRDPRAAIELWRDSRAATRRLGETDPVLEAILAWNELEAGEWDVAEDRLRTTLESDLEAADRANVLSVVLRIRAWRDEPVAELMAELEALIGDSSGAANIATIAAARCDMLLASGRLAEARAQALASVRAYPGLARYELSEAACASLWGRDVDGARADLTWLEQLGLHGRVFELIRTRLRAGIAACEGGPDALRLFLEARAGWLELGQVLEAAFVAIDMATLLDPSDAGVRAAAADARELLVRLRVAPFIGRLDAAMASGDTTPAVGASTSAEAPHR